MTLPPHEPSQGLAGAGDAQRGCGEGKGPRLVLCSCIGIVMRAATLKKPNGHHPRVISMVGVRELGVPFCLVLASLWDHGEKNKRKFFAWFLIIQRDHCLGIWYPWMRRSTWTPTPVRSLQRLESLLSQNVSPGGLDLNRLFFGGDSAGLCSFSLIFNVWPKYASELLPIYFRKERIYSDIDYS